MSDAQPLAGARRQLGPRGAEVLPNLRDGVQAAGADVDHLVLQHEGHHVAKARTSREPQPCPLLVKVELREASRLVETLLDRADVRVRSNYRLRDLDALSLNHVHVARALLRSRLATGEQ